MIPVEQAREIILARIETLPAEKVYLLDALSRHLAYDIYSDRDIPPWDNSAMDGYALRYADIDNTQDQTLKIAYELPAGKMPKGPLEKGTAVKIMTGAPIPPGTDTVIKREDTEEYADKVIIKGHPKRFDHIRQKGEDMKNTEMILSAGTRLNPAHIGLLASVRRPLVYCTQRPVVAIISTGDEIADLDEEITQQMISSSNSYTLIGLVSSLGAIPLYIGIARDNRKDLLEKISMAKRADLLLTTGGVSMGDYDMVKDVMKEKNNTMDFWKVDMKPGRPLAFGTINSIPAIGLPGNPVSTMTSFYQFARPAILKMMGARELLLPRLRARLLSPIKNDTARRHYVRGIIDTTGPDPTVRITGAQGSGILSSMAKGNCYVVVPKGKSFIDQGEMVDCEVFYGLI